MSERNSNEGGRFSAPSLADTVNSDTAALRGFPKNITSLDVSNFEGAPLLFSPYTPDCLLSVPLHYHPSLRYNHGIALQLGRCTLPPTLCFHAGMTRMATYFKTVSLPLCMRTYV